MKKITRLLCMLLAITALFAAMGSLGASATSFECKVQTYSDSILMVNLDTGMEVYSKDPDSKRFPAGLTKVMTYIIAAEYFDDFNTRIEIKKKVIDDVVADGMMCTGLDWHVGEKLTVTDTVIEIASDSVELEDAIAAGGTVTFKVTTEHGTATYEAEVQE